MAVIRKVRPNDKSGFNHGPDLPQVSTLFSTRHTKIFYFLALKNVARKLFHFGSGSKNFTRQNEKNLAPLLQETQTEIGAFSVRIAMSA